MHLRENEYFIGSIYSYTTSNLVGPDLYLEKKVMVNDGIHDFTLIIRLFRVWYKTPIAEACYYFSK